MQLLDHWMLFYKQDIGKKRIRKKGVTASTFLGSTADN